MPAEKRDLTLIDILQLVIGAAVLATPISFTQEAWELSNSLATGNVICLFIASIFFIAIFVYNNYFKDLSKPNLSKLLARILIAYIVTVITVSLILLLLDKNPLLTDPALSLKRAVIISFPASMGAIVSDSLD